MTNSPSPGSKQPVSPRRLAANRANAARSTGPRTPDGKARSAQNARRHGFAAADFTVVSLEDLQAVANLKADLVAVCQPINSQELFALERIALAQQALLRVARLEAGLLTYCLDDAVDSRGEPFLPMEEALIGDQEVTPGQDHNFALAHGFSRMVQRGNTWTLFLRYQAQTERHYRRAIAEFERLKALRHEVADNPGILRADDEKPGDYSDSHACPQHSSPPPNHSPNEPNAKAQPEQTQTTSEPEPPAAPFGSRPHCGARSPAQPGWLPHSAAKPQPNELFPAEKGEMNGSNPALPL